MSPCVNTNVWPGSNPAGSSVRTSDEPHVRIQQENLLEQRVAVLITDV